MGVGVGVKVAVAVAVAVAVGVGVKVAVGVGVNVAVGVGVNVAVAVAVAVGVGVGVAAATTRYFESARDPFTGSGPADRPGVGSVCSGNTGSLNTARYAHTATLLPNGKVLVAGGYNNGVVLSSAEPREC